MLSLPNVLCVACVWLGRDRNPAPRASSCCPVQSPQSLNPRAPGQSPASSQLACLDLPVLGVPGLLNHLFWLTILFSRVEPISILKCQVPTTHLFRLAHLGTHAGVRMRACTHKHSEIPWWMQPPHPDPRRWKARQAGHLWGWSQTYWRAVLCGEGNMDKSGMRTLHTQGLSKSGFATTSLLLNTFKNLYDKNLKCSFMKWWVDFNESNLKSPMQKIRSW